jgi:integrase
MGSNQQARTVELDKHSVAKLIREAAKDARADAIYFDGDLTGFGLRLRRSGDTVLGSYVVQYRSKGRTRRLKIGSVKKLSADEARKSAKKALAKVELGEDPQADKAAARAKAQNTMRAVVAEYLKTKEATLRPASYKVTKLYLTGSAYFGPLHNAAITDITLSDIAARITAITRKNGTPTAGRARAALSAMFRWAMGQGLMGSHPTNPVAATNRPPAAVEGTRVLKDAELAAVWKACAEDEYGRIVRLLILTACRRQEIGGLLWNEIDYDKGAIILPGERVKNGNAHTVPLSDAAIEIIRSVPRQLHRATVFGGHRRNSSGFGFTDWYTGKQDLDRRIKGSAEPWKLHDLRRTVATKLAEDLGIQPHLIEEILNHTAYKSGVAGTYNKAAYEKDKRAALAKWAEQVAEIVARPRLKETA